MNMLAGDDGQSTGEPTARTDEKRALCLPRDVPFARERLTAAARNGTTYEVVLVLRGQVIAPTEDGRGRWRLRTSDGHTAFAALDVMTVTEIRPAP